MGGPVSGEAFADTNDVLHLLSLDATTQRAREVIAERPLINVQVLNEVTNVARRKQALKDKAMIWGGEPPRAQLSADDAMIVALALLAGCDTLYSEDLHAGLRIEDALKLLNPFADLPEA